MTELALPLPEHDMKALLLTCLAVTVQALSEAPKPISRATVSSLRRKAGELAAVAILAATPDPAQSMETLLKAGPMATALTPTLQQRLDRSSKDFREEQEKRTLATNSDLEKPLDNLSFYQERD